MAANEKSDFLAGVIEGFYGEPWSQNERFELLDWMSQWGLNTYFHAPKDDLKHRAIWREIYSSTEIEILRKLVEACRQRNIRFIFALSPGLDIRYSNTSEQECLEKRFQQMLDLGCENFSLLFDDIPDRTNAEDAKQIGSLASAQCDVANAFFKWIRKQRPKARFLFCPTPYCGRMARNKLSGDDYLPTIGRELLPEIDVFWTGPEIISPEITVNHAHDLQKILRRKPLIWDNLHANDYDGRRFYCGPYAGRPTALRSEVSGILVNPNNEFPLNYIPIRTFAEFVNCEANWDGRRSYLAAMKEWLPQFATIGEAIDLEDLILFGDCYYLPHEEGLGAKTFYESARNLLTKNPAEWGDEAKDFLRQASRLREFCNRVTHLQNRPLFYSLSRRVWELREELDLLERYVALKSEHKNQTVPCRSDFHLPGTYRGGLVAKLQHLLIQQTGGMFTQRLPLMDALKNPSIHNCIIRSANEGDKAGAYHVCFKTGDSGKDGEPFYREDPDALGRIFVGPYLKFEPALSLILEDEEGICGYALGAFDTRVFFNRYETEWRPNLCAQYHAPEGDQRQWTRVQEVYHWYHNPDYFIPEPYEAYPSHLHIDLLPRAQGRRYGRRMLQQMMDKLRQLGSPGVHLGVSVANARAIGFYKRLGFEELSRVGSGSDGCIYMGKHL